MARPVESRVVEAGSPIEREIKVALPDAAALERVAEAVRAGLAVAQTNVFFDTADRRLAASGHGLRLRFEPGRAELTLKGPDTGRTGVSVRREVAIPVDPAAAEALARGEGRIESLAGAPVREALPLTGGLPLAPRLRFTNVRRIARVRIDRVECEVACDATTFGNGSIDHEIEIEVPDAAAIPAAERWLAALLARLGIAGRPQPLGKATRAARRTGAR